MRRALCVVFLIALTIISLNFASAISTSIKDSYLPGETIITEVSGNILEPIASSDVELRRGNVLVPIDYEIKKIGDRYYLWLIAPEQQMNYTLRIKGITTYVSGKIQKINYEKNFSVSGNLTDYSVKPGFISAEKDFEIRVQLNEDNEKTIPLIFIEESSFTLKPGENIIKFSILEINESGLYNASIGKYEIPAYIKVNKTGVSPINASNATSGLDLTNLTYVTSVTKEEEEAINKERAKYHCYEFPGKICEADEVCSGESITSLDGACCVNGDCKAKDEGGSSAWIGYLIAAVVIIAVVVIWMRYKKVKKEENPLIKKVLSFEKKLP